MTVGKQATYRKWLRKCHKSICVHKFPFAFWWMCLFSTKSVLVTLLRKVANKLLRYAHIYVYAHVHVHVCTCITYQLERQLLYVTGNLVDGEGHSHLGLRLHDLDAMNFDFWISQMQDTPDDVIKWKHFPRYWPFVRGSHRSLLNSPRKGQWRGALMFSLICAWINIWVNNREADDLRRHRDRYDVTVMSMQVYFRG